ncbi:MAG: hypothetical protein ACI31G_00195 [Bacilli bacterium]
MDTSLKIKSTFPLIIRDSDLVKGKRLLVNKKVSFLSGANKGSDVRDYTFLVKNSTNNMKNVCKLSLKVNGKKEVVSALHYVCSCKTFFANNSCEHLAASILFLDSNYENNDVNLVEPFVDNYYNKDINRIIEDIYRYKNNITPEQLIKEIEKRGYKISNVSVDDLISLYYNKTLESKHSYFNLAIFFGEIIKNNNYTVKDAKKLLEKCTGKFYDPIINLVSTKIRLEDEKFHCFFYAIGENLVESDDPIEYLKSLKIDVSMIFKFIKFVKKEDRYKFLKLYRIRFNAIDDFDKYQLMNIIEDIIEETPLDNTKVNAIRYFYISNFSIVKNQRIFNSDIVSIDLIFFEFLMNHKEIFEHFGNHIIYFLLNSVELNIILNIFINYPSTLSFLIKNKGSININECKFHSYNIEIFYKSLLSDNFKLKDIEGNVSYLYHYAGLYLKENDETYLNKIFVIIKKNIISKRYFTLQELNIIKFLLSYKYKPLINLIEQNKNKINSDEVKTIYKEYLLKNNIQEELSYKPIRTNE